MTTIQKGKSIFGAIHFRMVLSIVIKRVMDIVLSLLGLIFLSPFLIFVAWRIKRDSSGPLFYRGLRAGKDGKNFYILKFRTMYEQQESYEGPVVTASDDPRVTRVGRSLRDTKINELPQLWNVLKGEMSLVGPRPEDPDIVAAWPDNVRREILSMMPGITSPASIIYRDEEFLLKTENVMQTYLEEILPSKLRLDQLYIRHRSFWNDIDIIFLTLMVLPRNSSSSVSQETTIFFGPIAKLMERFANWFTADTLITLAALAICGVIWRLFGPINLGLSLDILIAVSYAVIYSLINAILGVYRIEWRKATAQDALDLIPGVVVATIIVLLANNLWPNGFLGIERMMLSVFGTYSLVPSSMLVLAAGMSFFGYMVLRYRTRLVSGLAMRWVDLRKIKSPTEERVLIIGGGETSQIVAWILCNGNHSIRFRLVGCVDDNLYKQGIRIRGVNVLGQRGDIPTLVAKHEVDIIVFAIHNISAESRDEILKICLSTSARVVFFPDIIAALSELKAGINHTENQASSDFHEQYQSDFPSDYLLGGLYLNNPSLADLNKWLEELMRTGREGTLIDLLDQIKKMHDSLQSGRIIQLNISQVMVENQKKPEDIHNV